MPSGQSRVYRVTQLRTDDVHCRESTGTGLVVLKVVPVTGAAFAGLTMDQLNVRLSLLTPIIGMLYMLFSLVGIDYCMIFCMIQRVSETGLRIIDPLIPLGRINASGIE